MQAIYNIKNSIITRLIDTSEQNIDKYLNENEDFKTVPFSNDLSVGENINKFTAEGRIRPNSELVAMGLITLGDDEVLDSEVIRPLTEEEMNMNFPDRVLATQELVHKEKTIGELIADKEAAIKELKAQYLDADIDDDEDLKISIKADIKTIKEEIVTIQGVKK